MSALSPRGEAILLSVGEMMHEDYSPSEIGELSERSAFWVSTHLTLLRSELALQTGFLPLSDPDYEALFESIKAHGIRTPVLLGQHIAIIDGRNRCNIAVELGIREIPVVFIEDLSWEEEHDLSLTLNIARRQLGISEKKEVVRSELLRDWGRSDRKIASVCGVHHETVGKIRLQLWREKEDPEAEEEITEEDLHDFQSRRDALDELAVAASKQRGERSQQPKTASEPKPPREEKETRVGLDGKTRTVTMREEEPKRPFDWEKDAPEIGKIAPTGKKHFATCPNCASMLTVHFDGSEYSLTHDRD